ncbi:sedoheptulose-1,7-bisphosphatase [Xylariaceae sp. FL1272]|nr:sedoheptulose-1,7-bisphosphatase [Xylariaceae sp. FL1272]
MPKPHTNKMASTLQSALSSALGATHPVLLNSIIPTLLQSINSIATTLRTAHVVSQAGSSNAFGDDQLNVDVLAENHIRASLASCPAVVTASSEEDPVERPTNTKEGDEVYTVAFDPLDGSSIIAPNWTVGTIIGVWAGKTALGSKPVNQVASVIGVYGPRTIALIALRIPGREEDAICVEVGIHGEEIEIIRPRVRLDEQAKTKYFAPANLRAASEDSRYMALISEYISQRYTLRYSGGLVPDVVHALVKGHGIYISPVTAGSKAKLRRLYELYPIALLLECAGGRAIDPTDGHRILEKVLEDLNETAGLVCGTAHEVEKVRGALVG